MDPHADYLSRLGTPLVGSRRAKRDLLAEVAGHLEDATEVYLEEGLSPELAAAEAERDFGEPAELVGAYQATLSAGLVRRVGLILIAGLGVQAFAWSGDDQTDPQQAQLHDIVTWVGVATGVVAVVTLLACGRGIRWWGRRPGLLRIASLAMLTSAVAIIGIAVLMNQVVNGGSGLGGLAFAVAVVGVPFGWVTTDCLRVLRGLELVRD